MKRIVDYFIALRPYLTLMSIPCWFVGFSLAYNQNYTNFLNGFLALIGALLLHLSVNAFNELFDYLRGNDTIEGASTYSGGGGYLVRGIITPFEMGTFAIILFLMGTSIGIILSFQHKLLLLIGLIGAIMILLYTPVFKPIGLGEIAMIIGFSCITIGTYISMANTNQYNFNPLFFILFILPGIWKSTVLIINEFPDYENDKKANVKNWVVRLGTKNLSYVYLLMMTIFYFLIIFLFYKKVINVLGLLSLITLPMFINNFIKSLNYSDIESHIPVMKNQINLGYISLFIIGISLIIGKG